MKTNAINDAPDARILPDINHRIRIPAWALDDYVDRIAKRFQPHKIVLFGSYARGQVRRESDVDLLIVMTTRGQRRPSLTVRREVPCPFPVDLVVIDPKRLEQRLRLGDWFLRDAVAEGKTLYERPNS